MYIIEELAIISSTDYHKYILSSVFQSEFDFEKLHFHYAIIFLAKSVDGEIIDRRSLSQSIECEKHFDRFLNRLYRSVDLVGSY